MRLSLRERRKQETAREIQRVTLRLAAERGFDSVTTEAISEAAGISQRTFFNYYTNKEAAAVGDPPKFCVEDTTLLRRGSGAFSTVLRQFAESHLSHIDVDVDTMRLLGPVIKDSPAVRAMFDAHLAQLRQELTDCFAERLPDVRPGLHESAADWMLHTIKRAFVLWLESDGLTLRAALDEIWEDEITLAAMISARPPDASKGCCQ